MKIEIALYAPSLSKQLRKFKIGKDQIKGFQQDRDAISWLYTRGIIPETTYHKALRVLTKKIKQECSKIC